MTHCSMGWKWFGFNWKDWLVRGDSLLRQLFEFDSCFIYQLGMDDRVWQNSLSRALFRASTRAQLELSLAIHTSVTKISDILP